MSFFIAWLDVWSPGLQQRCLSHTLQTAVSVLELAAWDPTLKEGQAPKNTALREWDTGAVCQSSGCFQAGPTAPIPRVEGREHSALLALPPQARYSPRGGAALGSQGSGTLSTPALRRGQRGEF